MISISITAGGTDYDRTIDPEALTLGFLEDIEKAQESGKWRDLIPAISMLLDLPREAVREVSIAQFKQISQALQAAGAVPNESTSSSERL